jgi:prepilin-type N-terminal cleavage/methylation domain-containing protein
MKRAGDMNMRKGMTLVELLVVIVVLPIFMLAFDKLFKTVAKDLPRSYRVVNENVSLLNMLEKLRQDVDLAKGLPKSYGNYSVSDKQFLIEQVDGVICYRFEDGEVLRYKLIDGKISGSEEAEDFWILPHAVIQWRILEQNGNGYAIEVRKQIEHNVLGHLEKKLSNSYVFYVGAF